MIASLFGAIRSLRLDQAVIEVNGVGYLIHITAKSSTNLSVGRDYQIFTSMVVREDSMTLYGFLSIEERDLFELVQTISGIGPKVALAITAAMNQDDLADAIVNKNEAAISAIPGIGKKGAQRLILELEGKVQSTKTINKSSTLTWRDQLVDALTGLGFTRRQSEVAISEMTINRDNNELSALSSSELLKMALAHANTLKGLGK